MRLRTEMLGIEPGDALLVYDADCGLSPERQAEHDAMAAHALLQAMGEADEQDGNVSGQWGSCIEQIRQRAAEILAGWLGEE